MKKNIFFLLIVSLFISCKSNKVIVETESQYYTDSIYSNSLSEYRKHNIYLPKGFNKNKNYPIIYATDGSDIKNNDIIKNTLDSLINNQIIQPIIVVESYSNSKITEVYTFYGDGRKHYYNYRNFEYVKTRTTDSLLAKRFDNHMNYFTNEMINHIEKSLKQKKSKKNRYFYGVSNGAGFGMSLLNKHPKLIGTYLCFSTFGGDAQTNTWRKDIKYPNLYMIYGTEEPFFLKNDADFMKKVYLDSNSFAEIRSFEGGHDYKIWNQELIKLLTKLFSVNNK